MEAIVVGIKIFIVVLLMTPTSALISKKLDTKKQISLAIKKYSLQSKSLLAIKMSGDGGQSKSFGRWARSLVLGNNCLQLVNVGSGQVGNLSGEII